MNSLSPNSGSIGRFKPLGIFLVLISHFWPLLQIIAMITTPLICRFPIPLNTIYLNIIHFPLDF